MKRIDEQQGRKAARQKAESRHTAKAGKAEPSSSAQATEIATAADSEAGSAPHREQLPGDLLQQSPEELRMNDAMEKWLEETAWEPGTTKSGKAVFVHKDTDERRVHVHCLKA